MSPELLALLRGEKTKIDMGPEDYEQDLAGRQVPIGSPRQAAHKRHRLHQIAQQELRESLDEWGDRHRAAGIPDSQSYRRFWLQFGVDVMTAQGLDVKATTELHEKLQGVLL